MVGNPNHGKDGKFSSGPGGADTGHGHNAGKGNRKIVKQAIRQFNNAGGTIAPYDPVYNDSGSRRVPHDPIYNHAGGRKYRP